MRPWYFWSGLFLFLAALVAAPGTDRSRTRVADGFDLPVGKPDGDGYYMARGFLSYHPGEDWNGVGGGNSDLGAPVYSIGHGIVTFARDARLGWGNVVLVRHVYLEGGKLQTIDSMYAHLDKIVVREGQQITRGQQVGTIGTNRGMYIAHLHFEIRKNLYIGINRSAYARDLTNYHRPSVFITQRRKLSGGGRSTVVVVNTYKYRDRLALPSDDVESQSKGKTSKSGSPSPSPQKRPAFQVNRFEEL